MGWGAHPALGSPGLGRPSLSPRDPAPHALAAVSAGALVASVVAFAFGHADDATYFGVLAVALLLLAQLIKPSR